MLSLFNKNEEVLIKKGLPEMSNESFKVEILAEIERRIKGFYEDPTHMESYIKDSRSVVVEYNGRQIFEKDDRICLP